MDFTVFSKDGCPFCDKIIEILETSNLRYVVYKLDKEFTKDQFYEVFGEGSMFPQVQVDEHPNGKRTVDRLSYTHLQNNAKISYGHISNNAKVMPRKV